MKKTVLDFQKQLATIQKMTPVQQKNLKGGGGSIIVEDAEGF